MVSMDAFQAFDGGSIPPERIPFASPPTNIAWAEISGNKPFSRWVGADRGKISLFSQKSALGRSQLRGTWVHVRSVRGVMVSMDAFQAFDGGSIPPERIPFAFPSTNVAWADISGNVRFRRWVEVTREKTQFSHKNLFLVGRSNVALGWMSDAFVV